MAEGNFGTVSKALWRSVYVAVKEIKMRGENPSLQIQKFEEEIFLWCRLRPHPNVGERFTVRFLATLMFFIVDNEQFCIWDGSRHRSCQ